MTGIIKVITAPVLEIMRLAITSLGVASLITSYFSNQKLIVTPKPGSHITFAVDPAPGNPGTFMATTASLTKDWPAALLDCAQATNVALPDLIKAGDTATWTPVVGAGLVTLKSTTSTVQSDRTTTVDFVSGTESAEAAKGPEQTNIARVSVRLPRKEISDFLDLAVNQLESVKTSVLAAIPSPLQPAAQRVFAQTIDPITNRIRAEIQGAVGGVLTLKGEGFVWVTYHRPKDPEDDPNSEPADPQDGAFCEQFRAKVATANEALKAEEVDVFR